MTGPPNGNIAPPGYYMLFLINNAGVPSVAKFVQVSTAPADVPPTGTITTPATSTITINQGQSVTFAGTGTATDWNDHRIFVVDSRWFTSDEFHAKSRCSDILRLQVLTRPPLPLLILPA